MTKSCLHTCLAIILKKQDHTLQPSALVWHQVCKKVVLLHLSHEHIAQEVHALVNTPSLMLPWATSLMVVFGLLCFEVHVVNNLCKCADMLQPKGNLTFPEELEDDYLLMESLDLPPASVLPR